MVYYGTILVPLQNSRSKAFPNDDGCNSWLIMITGVIKAKERRDVMTCDIPNAFIQALLPKTDPGEDRVVMKITGVLVDMLVDINPELYGPAVVLEKRPYMACLKQRYCGTRHLERTLKTLDSSSIHMTHAWQTRRFKDCNRQFYSTWTI
jgi:hypothetical protein